jgi:hypothetical protein
LAELVFFSNYKLLENIKFDLLVSMNDEDPEISELFSIWKHQRKLTEKAILLSGAKDAEMNEGWLIHNAGCTTTNEGSSLPLNISSEEKILEMIKAMSDVVSNQEKVKIFVIPFS